LKNCINVLSSLANMGTNDKIEKRFTLRLLKFMNSVLETGISSLFGKYFTYQSIIGIRRIIPNKSAGILSVAIFFQSPYLWKLIK
jgi:hypothetical protein